MGGCSFTTAYNPGYISDPPRAESDKLPGKALVFTEKADDAYVFTGKPTSFTGGGTTLTSPLGLITSQMAVRVFGDVFKGGAEAQNVRDAQSAYAVVVQPKITRFTYEYNQLKNVGFAITPTVLLTLRVRFYGRDGGDPAEKLYDSGTVEGESYMASGQPGETINKTLHRALNGLYRRAADDLIAMMKSGAIAAPVNPATATPASGNAVAAPPVAAKPPAEAAPAKLDDLLDLLPPAAK